MAHYSIFLLECAVMLVRDDHERQDIIDELHKADESFRDEWLCPHRPVDLTECDRQSLEERSQEVREEKDPEREAELVLLVHEADVEDLLDVCHHLGELHRVVKHEDTYEEEFSDEYDMSNSVVLDDCSHDQLCDGEGNCRKCQYVQALHPLLFFLCADD